ncbi:MAG: sialate O-acetylesterase [Planctomycetes bacterium]|nr:sialate O-acetylesterase [Planctomycetota bacterium]
MRTVIAISILIGCWGVAQSPWQLGPLQADDRSPSELTLRQPVPFQVCQRIQFDPAHAHANEPGGPKLGFADVALRGALAAEITEGELEWRVEPLRGGTGAATAWAAARDPSVRDRQFHAIARIPAGGWYRMQLRWKRKSEIVAEAVLEPLGVGELFVVAGQSYATNCNDERLKVQDPGQRIAAYDPATHSWRVAEDPQPAPDGSDGGSIWPAVGDLLLPSLRVPIGFVNVAWGGTSSRQWLPGEALHRRLCAVEQNVGRFRAVLWQQGESDVIEKTSSEQYVENLQRIRGAAEEAWGFAPPWLLAKSTLHPTVYVDPVGEGRIRTAIDQLARMPGFRAGPDTDLLDGDNRGGPGSRRHFSAAGQRRAAELWFATLVHQLNQSSAE